jgi:hypothetical protein
MKQQIDMREASTRFLSKLAALIRRKKHIFCTTFLKINKTTHILKLKEYSRNSTN